MKLALFRLQYQFVLFQYSKYLINNIIVFLNSLGKDQDIIQFFLSLNHQLLPIILDKAGFDYKISKFFSNYLVNRKTTYLWNNFSSPLYNVRIGVTNFIQLVSLQPVDRFSQAKLHWKAPNEGYPHICRMYKSNNKWLRYQAISSCTSFIC